MRLGQLRLATWIRLMVNEHHPSGQMTEKQITDFYKEKLFLISQLKQLTDESAWWSNEEWDWFLNRCLDFLGAPK